ncbi:MAG: DUF1295 domain-containing protein [Gammaproteobacteria bacterium]|nr:DUF1295 domain-containing protein [Gammaproteobacteria bacterium]
MNKKTLILLSSIVLSVVLATLISLAGGDGGARVGSVSVFALCAIVAFVINWLAFIPANLAKTERYYDLTGSATYLSVIVLAVTMSDNLDSRALIVAAMVAIWAIRLGSFLFSRIARDGKDDRFDTIKTDPLRFFLTWTIQALWVVLTAACALAIITGGSREPIGAAGVLGICVWVFGFTVEVIADQQKSNFKKNPENKGKFINTGLWRWSRHPNYFGEMVLWTGIAIIALPVLTGWQWATLISPVFVYVLINYVSGVNKLEKKAEEKWGNDADYQTYRKNTPILVLWPPEE